MYRGIQEGLLHTKKYPTRIYLMMGIINIMRHYTFNAYIITTDGICTYDMKSKNY